MSDKKLLELIANERSSVAFTALYNKYSGFIFRQLLASVRRDGVVSDISQNMWLYVWLNAGYLAAYIDEGSSVKGLLANIVAKRIADYYRASSVQSTVSLGDISAESFVGSMGETSESEMYVNEIKAITQKVLSRYPEIDRKCFIYQKQMGYPAAETARILGISEANVYKKVSLMSKELRAALEAAGYLPVAVIIMGNLL